jgi:hypothetical protein
MTSRFSPKDEQEYNKRVDFLAKSVVDEFRDEIDHFVKEENMKKNEAISHVHDDLTRAISNAAHDSDMTAYGNFKTLTDVLKYSEHADRVGISTKKVSNKMDLEKALEALASKALEKDIDKKVKEILKNL